MLACWHVDKKVQHQKVEPVASPDENPTKELKFNEAAKVAPKHKSGTRPKKLNQESPPNLDTPGDTTKIRSLNIPRNCCSTGKIQ
jgi:hypothetical protein